jgi:hypothetical protein
LQEAAGQPKVGEQGAASFRTDAARLAQTPSSVNQSDSDEILGPHSQSYRLKEKRRAGVFRLPEA